MKNFVLTMFSPFASLVLGALLLVGAGAAQATTTLPTCVVGVNCLKFGDFNVYSLPLLDLQSGGDGVPNPGDQYFFSSTYGAIKNFTIVGINNGQCTNTGNPTGSIDCSYNTPSKTGNTEGASTFSTKTSDTGGVADPGGPGEFLGTGGDTENTWDATTTTLLSLINGTPLTAFFAFNETGNSVGLEGTALLTWAEVTLHDSTGANADVHFFLSNNRCLIGSPGCVDDNLDPSNTYGTLLTTNTTEADTSNLPAANSNPFSPAINPWVYVHSGICTVGTNFVGFPDASGACVVGTLRNQNNLGQNAAAFMINSPALDTALNSGDYDVMQVLWKMGYIDGGGETAWIAPVSSGGAPEPATLANLGLGLLVLAYLARRRAG